MSEPYRYACPYGHRTVRRVGGKTHSHTDEKRWRCDTCKNNHEINGYHYDEVKDLKTGRLLAP